MYSNLSDARNLHQDADVVLKQTRAMLEEATAAVANRCVVDGRLNDRLLDENQLVSYELALASAETLAAETAYGHLLDASALDQKIKYVFIAESVVSALARLETVLTDLDADGTFFLVRSEELLRFRKSASSATVLSEIGAEIARIGVSFGEVRHSESVGMAQSAFRRFAQEVVAPRAEQIHREDLTVPRDIIDGMCEMGAFGLSIPEEYGGMAGDPTNDAPLMIAVTEALSEASLAAGGSLITRPEILSRALLVGGTEAQKNKWLPEIASGRKLCAIAITEPDFGSDVARLSLKASKTTEGWLLEGAKTWCTFAGMADLLMVVARTNPDKLAGHRGLSIFLVEKPSSNVHEFRYEQEGGGVISGRAIPTIGYRGMHSFDVHFENFLVPHENLVGEEDGLGRGFYFTMSGMTGGRMQTAGRASGVMRAALSAAIQYGCDRKVFGKPLINYSLTQARIAKMAARYLGCRQLTYSVAERIGSGETEMEASLAKLLACRSAELVTRDALQIHGGMGYAEETPVSRYFVDARVLSIFEGAEETLALKVIARTLLERALKAGSVA